jgi:hypothetical protein
MGGNSKEGRGEPPELRTKHLTPFIKLGTFYSLFDSTRVFALCANNNDQYSAFNLQLNFWFLLSSGG